VDIDTKISVYVITNILNGKCYVGITKDLEARWKDHCRNREVSRLQRAIKKYGVDAFEFKHIADAFSWEDACNIERLLIKEYNSKSPGGYNLTDGGDGGYGYKFSEEEVKNRSERMSTSANPMYGKFGEKNHFFGRKHSEETRAKMIAAWAIRKSKEGYTDPRLGKKRIKASNGY
jgi:group I intron endonuclease